MPISCNDVERFSMQNLTPIEKEKPGPTAAQLEIRRKLAHLSFPEKQKVLRMLMLAAPKHNQEALMELEALSKQLPLD
jgi:hypothetical protein